MFPSLQGGAPQRRAGFTLPDLLVIIGVVALLVLLWLPAHGALGRKAGVLECKNNLRQVGWAIDMYTRDHQDYLPGPIWSASSFDGPRVPNPHVSSQQTLNISKGRIGSTSL